MRGVTPKPGECEPLDGMICRRFYPGLSACRAFGGETICLRRPTQEAKAPRVIYDHKRGEY
jgi:hypothetical protein